MQLLFGVNIWIGDFLDSEESLKGDWDRHYC